MKARQVPYGGRSLGVGGGGGRFMYGGAPLPEHRLLCGVSSFRFCGSNGSRLHRTSPDNPHTPSDLAGHHTPHTAPLAAAAAAETAQLGGSRCSSALLPPQQAPLQELTHLLSESSSVCHLLPPFCVCVCVLSIVSSLDEVGKEKRKRKERKEDQEFNGPTIHTIHTYETAVSKKLALFFFLSSSPPLW